MIKKQNPHFGVVDPINFKLPSTIDIILYEAKKLKIHTTLIWLPNLQFVSLKTKEIPGSLKEIGIFEWDHESNSWIFNYCKTNCN